VTMEGAFARRLLNLRRSAQLPTILQRRSCLQYCEHICLLVLLRCTSADGFENERGARRVLAWWRSFLRHVFFLVFIPQPRLAASIGNARPVASRTSGAQAFLLCLLEFWALHDYSKACPEDWSEVPMNPGMCVVSLSVGEWRAQAIWQVLSEAPPTYAGAFSKHLTVQPPLQDAAVWGVTTLSCGNPMGNPSGRRLRKESHTPSAVAPM
jgi:hypothetical protein